MNAAMHVRQHISVIEFAVVVATGTCKILRNNCTPLILQLHLAQAAAGSGMVQVSGFNVRVAGSSSFRRSQCFYGFAN